jgi:hypothetical protein
MLTPLAVVACLAGALVPAAASAKSKRVKERSLDASFVVHLSTAPGNEASLPVTNSMTMWVPNKVRAAGERMPKCAEATIEQKGAAYCPRKSKVGTGIAKGYIYETIEPMSVTMYNGTGGTNVLLAHIVGTSPVSIDAVVVGKVTKPKGGKYGQQLYFPFPPSLIYPVPGSTASMVYLSARLPGKYGWLRSKSCPPTGWSLGAELGDVSGSITHIDADLKCV